MVAKEPKCGRNPKNSGCIVRVRRSSRFQIVCLKGLTATPRSRHMAKTMLIVDDNAYIRRALCEQFKRESGFEVCGEAENLAKALELHPDLIVLDLSMPVMNGLDAARERKRLMPSVPLVMYSAFADTFGEQEARLLGFLNWFPSRSLRLFWSAKPAVFSTATLRSHFFSQPGKPSLSLLGT
jgi:two-component system chemotaxis response regulator CheY